MPRGCGDVAEASGFAARRAQPCVTRAVRAHAERISGRTLGEAGPAAGAWKLVRNVDAQRLRASAGKRSCSMPAVDRVHCWRTLHVLTSGRESADGCHANGAGELATARRTLDARAAVSQPALAGG